MNLNLAILHYHLNRGGVTRVIENQLAALDAVPGPEGPSRVALIFGGRREGWNEDLPQRLKTLEITLYVVPSLDYDEHRGPGELSDHLAGLLGRIGFAPRETVLHVHNHALGKNTSLPASLVRLAGEGFALLLQIHDFSEDFRPANYRRIVESGVVEESGPGVELYPQAGHIHYAVLNGRDQAILRSAGVAGGRLHRLPNPVPEPDGLPPGPEARRRLAQRFGVAEHERLLLYPVRCIRRKNVGEALLYSALSPPGRVLGLTLPPLNPAEVPAYESWKRLAAELSLPCRFELGAPGALSFAESLAAADLVLTTSLAEGFGMVFLESWLAGRPLLGRDLPEITRDFTDLGLRLDWLRPRLDVPVAWVGADAFAETMRRTYRRTLQAYGREPPEDLPERVRARIDDGRVDFGDLDETLQEQVLRIVCQGEENRRRALEANPWIEEAFSTRRQDVAEVVDRNARAIHRHLSGVPSGRRLLELYRKVLDSPRQGRPEPLADASRMLDLFLDFRRFRPIRS